MKNIERNDVPEAVQCLSAHELATLLVLFQAPCDVMAATPDAMALRDAGFAQLVDSGKVQPGSRLQTKEMPCCGY